MNVERKARQYEIINNNLKIQIKYIKSPPGIFYIKTLKYIKYKSTQPV